jgi:F-type H+-transporting ATPase subunit c
LTCGLARRRQQYFDVKTIGERSVNNLVKFASLGFGALLLMATPILAQDGSAAPLIPNAVGIGLVVLGAGLGIGKLAAAALESMARQPEIAGSIQTAMIIAAALIEGLSFFGVFACWASGMLGG